MDLFKKFEIGAVLTIITLLASAIAFAVYVKSDVEVLKSSKAEKTELVKLSTQLETYDRHINQAVQSAQEEIDALPKKLPLGSIVAWSPRETDYISGKVVPPPGWAICNGTKGTPDLRNRFLVGAESASQVNQRGGSPTHSHGHAMGEASATEPRGKENKGASHKSHKHSLTIHGSSNLPPFYTVLYIMKI